MFNRLGVPPVTGLRQVNPCGMVTAGELQRIIFARSEHLTAPLTAIVGVRAFVLNALVDCSSGSVSIGIPIQFQSGSNMRTGFISLIANLEPVPISATVGPVTPCLRIGGYYVDVTSFPMEVQQQIAMVMVMLSSRRICLPAPPPLRQTR
ncbi:MAG TPA: hypothetical protein VNT75_33160 [Symbiobacteriaceae bacterium]|nr:hypothetical protein [Symbiobacteriaceae bacterium]